MSIDLCRAFPEVATLNLGGGYKVGRMSYEKVRSVAILVLRNSAERMLCYMLLLAQSTELAVVGVPVKDAFVAFAKETGRKVRQR
jgi:diaminopimelate decarboxylase